MEYYGIGKEGTLITLFLGNRFLKISFIKLKYYYYNKDDAQHCYKKSINLKWFFGLIR